MSFKSVNPNSGKFVTTKKWKEFSKGDFLIGTFEDVGTHKDKFGKDIYGFTVESSSFGAGNGETIYLNNGGNFQNLMNEVSLGDKVKIIYNGMVKITKGKWANTMTHDIDVQLSESEDDGSAL